MGFFNFKITLFQLFFYVVSSDINDKWKLEASIDDPTSQPVLIGGHIKNCTKNVHCSYGEYCQQSISGTWNCYLVRTSWYYSVAIFVAETGLPLCTNDNDCKKDHYSTVVCMRQSGMFASIPSGQGFCAQIYCPTTGSYVKSYQGNHGRCNTAADCRTDTSYRLDKRSVDFKVPLQSTCLPMRTDWDTKNTQKFCCVDPLLCPSTAFAYDREQMCRSDDDCAPYKRNFTIPGGDRHTIGKFCHYITKHCCYGELQCPKTPFILNYQPKCSRTKKCGKGERCFRGHCCPDFRHRKQYRVCSNRKCPSEISWFANYNSDLHKVYCDENNFLCISDVQTFKVLALNALPGEHCSEKTTCTGNTPDAPRLCYIREGYKGLNLCVLKPQDKISYPDRIAIVSFNLLVGIMFAVVLVINSLILIGVYLFLRRYEWKWKNPDFIQTERLKTARARSVIAKTPRTENM